MATVKVNTKLDNRGFSAGVRGMKSEVKGFGAQLKGIKGLIAGAFAIGAITRFVKAGINAASKITDLAVQTGLTTDEIQALTFASIEAGVAQEKIRAIISKLSVVLGQAKSGMITYVDLFNKAGISTERFIKLDTAGVLQAIAVEMQTATDGSVKFGAILELLGTRSGAQFREVMTALANKTLPGLVKQYEKLITAENKLIAADKVADAGLKILQTTLAKVGGFVGAGVVGLGKMGKVLLLAAKSGETLASAFAEIRKETRAEFGVLDPKEFAAKRALDIAAKKREIEDFGIRKSEQFIEKEKLAAKEREKQLEKEVKAREKISDLRLREIEKTIKAEDKLAAIQAGRGAAVGAEAADRLARIGGFVGGRISPAARTAERTIKIQEQTRDFLKDLPREIARELRDLFGLQ